MPLEQPATIDLPAAFSPLTHYHPWPLDHPDDAPVPCFTRPIGQAVAHVFGVDVAALDRETRGRADVALARQTAMYLAHVSCCMSLTAVGRQFSRDRTTVAHACAVIEDRRDDPAFDRALELLELVVQALASARSARLHQSTHSSA